MWVAPSDSGPDKRKCKMESPTPSFRGGHLAFSLTGKFAHIGAQFKFPVEHRTGPFETGLDFDRLLGNPCWEELNLSGGECVEVREDRTLITSVQVKIDGNGKSVIRYQRSHRSSHEITRLFQASTHILVEEIFYHPPSRFIILCKLDPDNFCSKGEGLKIYMPNFPSCLPACLALNADVILSYFLHEITEFQECKNHIRDAWRLWLSWKWFQMGL